MIAVIDCAIIRKSLHCYNGLVTRNDIPITYHDAPHFDLNYLHDCKAQGYIIFGSKSNVEDKLSWQIDLMNVMKKKIEQKIPVIGICFGHQLMCHAFGAEVGRSKQKNRGSRDVQIINNHLHLKKGAKLKLIMAHDYEVKNLPENFIHVGSSPECKYDIVAHSKLPFIGVQCHPEATNDFILKALEMNPPFSKGINEAMKCGITFIDDLVKQFLLKG